MSVSALLTAATTVAAGTAKTPLKAGRYNFQCRGATSSGAGTATVKVEVSNDGTGWVELGTFHMVLSASSGGTAQGFIADMNWTHARANITAISGTGANITVSMGMED